MNRSPLWMLLAPVDHPGLHAAVPTLAWMAADRGIALECYLEGPRSGGLFKPQIKEIASAAATPRSYLAFMDIDYATLRLDDPAI